MANLKSERCQSSIVLPEAKKRCCGEGRSLVLFLLHGRRESMEKVSDAFVILEKCDLPRVHIQNITFSRVEYEI
jgi:hypothetical protein